MGDVTPEIKASARHHGRQELRPVDAEAHNHTLSKDMEELYARVEKLLASNPAYQKNPPLLKAKMDAIRKEGTEKVLSAYEKGMELADQYTGGKGPDDKATNMVSDLIGRAADFIGMKWIWDLIVSFVAPVTDWMKEMGGSIKNKITGMVMSDDDKKKQEIQGRSAAVMAQLDEIEIEGERITLSDRTKKMLPQQLNKVDLAVAPTGAPTMVASRDPVPGNVRPPNVPAPAPGRSGALAPS